MTPKDKEITSEQYSEFAVVGMLEKKAIEIAVVDFSSVTNAVADYFVICSGTSDTQIDAISDAVEESIFKATGVHPWKKEGQKNKEWILIDYGNIVVHIFKKDRRAFYALEKLWGDANITYT